MTANPYEFWSAQEIATASGCPPESVPLNWPEIVVALDARGIADRATQIAAIGNIAIETASTFAPVREAFWLDEEWRRENLDYYPWYGRGYIQLTLESNYTAAGDALELDLEDNPDLALDPTVAAQVLAWYFATHGGGPLIPEAARRGDWTEVRRLVQGGSAGLDRLVSIATALGGDVPAPVYDSTAPVMQQQTDWGCAVYSTDWAMTAFGRHPAISWMEGQMIADGVESTSQGLLDASGAGLAAWITDQYGPDNGDPSLNYQAYHVATVTFNDVLSVAGLSPVLLGGRSWGGEGHWVGVRRYDESSGTLSIANPAENFGGVAQSLSRAQFDAVGPVSMVVINWGAPVPQPAPPTTWVVPSGPFIGLTGPELQAKAEAMVSTLGYARGDLANDFQAAVNTLRGIGV